MPVLLPSRINLDYSGRTYAGGGGGNDQYALFLDARPRCGGNACFLAQFSAERGGTPAFRRTAKLANGITGYYKPLSCGGSCSPPMIQSRQRRVLFSIQAKLGVSGASAQRREMIRAANSAIRSRPR